MPDHKDDVYRMRNPDIDRYPKTRQGLKKYLKDHKIKLKPENFNEILIIWERVKVGGE